MAFPSWAFPHPGANDAIILADLEWPVILLTVVGAVVAYAVFGNGKRGAVVRVAVGVFLVGAAIALVVGLITFGNTSDDRFGPLLFFPPVIALVGLAGIVVAVAAGFRHRSELLRGALYGFALALFFGGWTLARGARAWLLAPYGFDLFLLILILGVGLVVLGTSPRVSRSAPPG